jgi:hypothetical protein
MAATALQLLQQNLSRNRTFERRHLIHDTMAASTEASATESSLKNLRGGKDKFRHIFLSHFSFRLKLYRKIKIIIKLIYEATFRFPCLLRRKKNSLEAI